MSRRRSLTMDRWFTEWLDLYKSRRVKTGTLRNYRAVYRAYLRGSFGNRLISDITPVELQLQLNSLVDDGYSGSTVRLVSAVLSGMFKTAHRIDLIRSNPMLNVECPRGRETVHHRALSREQQAVFMEYASYSKFCDLFRIAVCSGLRYGELAALMWCNVDFARRLIHVRYNLVRVQGGYLIDTPKTRSSIRSVPMVERAYDILRERAAALQVFPDNAALQTSDQFVFAHNGHAPEYEIVSRELGIIKRRILDDGIDFPRDFTLHGTRDSFATRCVESGMSLYILRDILGHSTIKQTEVYAQTMSDALHAAMRTASDAF